MFEKLKEVKYFQESCNVKSFKEIKRLRSLQKVDRVVLRTQESIYDGTFM